MPPTPEAIEAAPGPAWAPTRALGRAVLLIGVLLVLGVVLGRVDERSAAAWARLTGRRSVALVAHGSPAAAVGVLEDRGWRCVPYRSSDDLRTLWHEHVEAAGAAR